MLKVAYHLGLTCSVAWARRIWLHQPVELPVGDFHRPGRCRFGGRQFSRCQARARFELAQD